MCGITGSFTFGGLMASEIPFVRWSTDQMHRRGPDAEGFLAMGQAAFGFRRLAIRDLRPEANQPMKDPSGRYFLAFNGELYHTESLKAKLSPTTVYRTHSDTEVLLHCLVQWGVERTLPLLDGMFAFAWYDSASSTLALARDRCGIKPLYYARNHRVLLFCSEYDLLLCHDDFRNASLNLHALSHYLRLGFVPDGEAMYQQTCLLPHGYWLTVQGEGKTELKKYADYPWHPPHRAACPLHESIQASVQSQLVADVPVGVFQSGGIDSSIVSAAAFHADRNVEGFTIGVESSDEMDERHVAGRHAQSLGMRHHVRTISSTDVLSDLIAQNTRAFSEPFADYSSLPTLLLSQFARGQVKVALSGDGGDELFWGYPRNREAASYLSLFAHGTLPRALRILWKRAVGSGKPIPYNLLKYNNFADFSFQKTFITGSKNWAGRIFPHQADAPFFLQKLLAELETAGDISDFDWMNVLRKIEFDFHLQRVLLKVDRASSYHGLEVRVPLLSNAMLDASYAYPYTDCIQGEQGKVPLRNLLAKNTAYPGISQLPKKGFTVPMGDWANGLLSGRIAERLQVVPNALDSYFDKKEIQHLLDAGKNQTNTWIVWAMFTLFEWQDKRLEPLKADYQNYKLCHP